MTLRRLTFWAGLVAGATGWLLATGLDHWFARLVALVIFAVAVAIWTLAVAEKGADDLRRTMGPPPSGWQVPRQRGSEENDR